eukprot:scaffold1574_cov373-Prasinococcus_capsulatus_cf.AAC.15
MLDDRVPPAGDLPRALSGSHGSGLEEKVSAHMRPHVVLWPGTALLAPVGHGDGAHRHWAQYELGRELGRGQFGVTYKAVDKLTGEEFACKSISKASLRTQQEFADIRREVEIMYHVSGGEHVVSIVEAFETRTHVHMVMELCRGGELFDRIIQNKYYSEAEAARLMRCVLRLVSHCHDLEVGGAIPPGSGLPNPLAPRAGVANLSKCRGLPRRHPTRRSKPSTLDSPHSSGLARSGLPCGRSTEPAPSLIPDRVVLAPRHTGVLDAGGQRVLRRAGGAQEAVQQGGRHLELRGHPVHPSVRCPALLGGERGGHLQEDPEGGCAALPSHEHPCPPPACGA